VELPHSAKPAATSPAPFNSSEYTPEQHQGLCRDRGSSPRRWMIVPARTARVRRPGAVRTLRGEQFRPGTACPGARLVRTGRATGHLPARPRRHAMAAVRRPGSAGAVPAFPACRLDSDRHLPGERRTAARDPRPGVRGRAGHGSFGEDARLAPRDHHGVRSGRGGRRLLLHPRGDAASARVDRERPRADSPVGSA
jgi:hypothetical protein